MFYFEVDLAQNTESFRPIPLFNDVGNLVGGATVRRGGSLACFLQDDSYSRLLKAEGLYFAPAMKDGVVYSGTLYEAKVPGLECIRVTPERIVEND